MPVFSAIILYASLWFLALFLVLPFGQQSQEDVGEVTYGTPRGAPYQHQLGRKMLMASGIAFVVWAILYWIIVTGVITRADVMEWDKLIRR